MVDLVTVTLFKIMVKGMDHFHNSYYMNFFVVCVLALLHLCVLFHEAHDEFSGNALWS